jgi:hypothetical protein
MIIIFIHRGLRPDNELREIVCERIERLPKLLHIEVAEFTLERSGPGGSLFTARIHLATAGKDYCAESRGRTKTGAIEEVLANLAIQFHQSSHDLSPGRSILRGVKVKASSRNQSLQITAN